MSLPLEEERSFKGGAVLQPLSAQLDSSCEVAAVAQGPHLHSFLLASISSFDPWKFVRRGGPMGQEKTKVSGDGFSWCGDV